MEGLKLASVLNVPCVLLLSGWEEKCGGAFRAISSLERSIRVFDALSELPGADFRTGAAELPQKLDAATRRQHATRQITRTNGIDVARSGWLMLFDSSECCCRTKASLTN